jgi:hypothetical protein
MSPASAVRRAVLVAAILVVSVAAARPSAHAAPLPQAGTSTPSPWLIEIYEQVTVRGGPGTYYDRVGILLPGQTSQVVGRSADNAWFKIVYVGAPNDEGWVLRANVRLVGEAPNMPTLVAPPTPTLPPTPTPPLDEVLGTGNAPATDPGAGRPPTFTPPAPEIRPTLLPAQGLGAPSGLPPAVLIAVLFVLGSFGGVLSAFRARR